jgi:LmbE family N-acetylglucosaminyl deacetylase
MKSRERLLIVSPHLDDAVLSCGLVLAAHPHAVVCTVFSAPPATNMTTGWDRSSGFANAFEAMNARKVEDIRALAHLAAHPLHLPFRDAQYDGSPTAGMLTNALQRTIAEIEPTALLVPLGLFHSDHTLTADACLMLMPRIPQEVAVHAYEDVPYRNMPGVVQKRLYAIAERGYRATATEAFDAAENSRHWQMKRAAVAAYRSQLRAFGDEGQADLFSPERYWQLSCTDSANGRGEWGDERHSACSTPLLFRQENDAACKPTSRGVAFPLSSSHITAWTN